MMQWPHITYVASWKTWVVLVDYEIGIDHAKLLIPEGFCFDMASVPRILGPWIQKFELGVIGPLVHDWGYQHGGHMHSEPDRQWKRGKVDSVFSEFMRWEGVSNWRRWAAYWAVRLFGWFAWRRERPPKGAQPQPKMCPPQMVGGSSDLTDSG